MHNKAAFFTFIPIDGQQIDISRRQILISVFVQYADFSLTSSPEKALIYCISCVSSHFYILFSLLSYLQL